MIDYVSTMLFCSSDNGVSNLQKEGIEKNIFRVGDVMCDTLEMIRPFLKRLYDQPYYFATVHRPYNTDDKQRLSDVLHALNALEKKVILPLHPRTLKKMSEFGLRREQFTNLELVRPVSYVSSICYQYYSDCVITDSGGMQKEAYMMKKRCITLRSETEWVETLKNGWNTLVFNNLQKIQQVINQPAGEFVEGLYGDGHAADDIARSIFQHLNNSN
jgi:UDP-GlcNAc3NAcA epimerase